MPAVGTTSGETWTYEQLFRFSNALSDWAAVGSGAPVIVATENSLLSAAALVALARNAVVIPLRPEAPIDDVHAAVETVGARYAIAEPPAIERLAAAGLATAMKVTTVGGHDIAACALECDHRPELPPGARIVLQTSGTTGSPKSVCLTEGVLELAIRLVAATLELGVSDCALNLASMTHTLGIVTNTLLPLATGGSILFCAPRDLVAVADWSARALRPTWCSAVPPVHRTLVQSYEDRQVRSRLPLRLIRNSAAPMPDALREAVDATFGACLVNAYAMTEAPGQIASTRPGEAAKGSVGIPTDCVKIASTDDTAEVIGEVCVRGPLVGGAYLDRAGHQPVSGPDGWFRTGDLGVVDSGGELHLCGRMNETINCGGEKVNPTALEERLRRHPLITDAAVAALKHASLGSQVAVGLITERGASVSPGEVRSHLRGYFAEAVLPRHVVEMTTFPVTKNGKLDRRGLARELERRVESRRVSQMPKAS